MASKRKRAKSLSLYPMKLEEALRVALSTPPPDKKQSGRRAKKPKARRRTP
jgi:hypothetical protein